MVVGDVIFKDKNDAKKTPLIRIFVKLPEMTKKKKDIYNIIWIRSNDGVRNIIYLAYSPHHLPFISVTHFLHGFIDLEG